MDRDIRRRAVLQAVGTFGVFALLPAGVRGAALAPTPSGAGRWLTAHELATLRAVTGRLVPGPPDDPDPGAVEAGVAEAIDTLLAAFTLAAPPIHAGGPFSDRAGAARDDFADFVALDPVAELGWRIRIEGSKGLAEREFAGPVVGLQQIYRDGLAHLDAQARRRFGTDFLGLPAATRDLLLSDGADAELKRFVDAALANTLEFMYGPPEYGGNRDLVGWKYTGWAGEAQPRGFTDKEVSHPDAGSLCLADGRTLALIETLLAGLAAGPELSAACPAAADSR